MLSTLRALWRARWPLIVVAAVVATWLLATQLYEHYEESARLSLPVRAQQTRAAQRWETRQIPGCPAVVEVLPPPKERRRLERDFGVALAPGVVDSSARPAMPVGAPGAEGTSAVAQGAPSGSGVLGAPGAPGTHVLGLFDVPRMPWGGEALATLPPDGRLDLRFKPRPGPFLSFRPTWGFGALVDPTKPQERWTGYVLVEPLHLRGRWHLRAVAGPEMRDGKTGMVIGLGAEWRSR